MKEILTSFSSANKKIKTSFGCSEDFFLKPLLRNEWFLKSNENTFFLTYKDDNGKMKNCVVAKKDNEPMIYIKDGFTMVVAIECVKIGFIFNNKNMA